MLSCFAAETTTNESRVFFLAAAAGVSAGHAAVAATASGHDGSAGGAAWAVAHVVEVLHGVGGVEYPSILEG